MIINVQIEELLLLSPVQQGLLAKLTAPENREIASLQKAYRWQGGIDEIIFAKAMGMLARNIPFLRASVHWQGLEKPLIVVQDQQCTMFRRQDCKNWPRAEQDLRFKELCQRERAEEFLLSQAPLARCVVVEITSQEHLLLWTFHPIIFDPQSLDILMRELCRLYESVEKSVEGGSSPFASATFKEYVSWITSREIAPFRAFWSATLQALRSDDGRHTIDLGATKFEEGNLRREQLQLSSVSASGALASGAESYFRAVLHGAWALLLNYYFGKGRVAFSTNVNGRKYTTLNIEQTLGAFEHRVPFLCAVPPEIHVKDWISLLQRHWDELNRYSGFGMDKIAEWSGWPDIDQLLDTALLVCDTSAEIAIQKNMGTITVNEMTVAAEDRSHSLTLSVRSAQGLVEAIYDSRFFDAQSMERLLKHFDRLVQVLPEQGFKRLDEIDILQDEESRQLKNWSTSEGVPASLTLGIHEVFEERVKQFPENIAAIFEDESINYRALNARANQLHAHLRHLGVKPETVVGVLMNRSLDTLVAMLAIFKAGGVYFPIDPELPKERISLLLEDAVPSVLLIQQDYLFELPLIAATSEIFCMDADWEHVSSYSEQDEPLGHSPKSLAYIIYTSGSTGKPKGVGVSHAAAVFHLNVVQKEFGYQNTDRVLQFASLSFDVSIEQLLAPLFSGATVVLKGVGPWDTAALLHTVERFSITVVNIPPAYWTQLADGELLRPLSLRMMIVGGDVMLPETLRRWQQTSLSDVELLNAYGPTESVVTATVFRVPPKFAESHDLRRVPIGRPLAGRKAYVVNSAGRLAPIGIWGELLLGGEALARCYLRHPELTAEKFVPNPFSDNPGEKVYRTGDLARYTSTGALEFLGRADGQVKIRGYRIELGEIETVLLTNEGIEQTVVVAREDRPGEKRLVGYLKMRQGAELTSGELQSYLKERLPEYMVPPAFVFLEDLPLTASGKIDRKSLSLPEIAPDIESYAGPRNQVEEILCNLWATLLQVERVGIHDNFFELGGDSILSIQMLTRAREEGLELAPNEVFERQTIAELAEVAIAVGPQKKIQIERVTGPAALGPLQTAFFQWRLARPDHYNQAVWLDLRTDVDSALLEKSIAALISHHESLRMKYEQSQDGWQQQCDDELPVGFYHHQDLSSLQEGIQSQELEQLALKMQASMRLESGQLFKAVEYDLGSQHGRRLLLMIHHLAVDGVSWRTLLEDIERIYEQLQRGEAVAVPAKTSSYIQWVEGMRSYSRTEEVLAEMKYWTGGFRNIVTRIPQDFPETAIAMNLVEAQSSIELCLNQDETQRLLHQVPIMYHTQINDALIAALARMLARANGDQSILIDVEAHGREAVLPGVDVSRTVGWFTSIYPLYLEVNHSWGVDQALKSIKEQLRGVPGRGGNYGALRYLSDDFTIRKRLQEMPQAEICFNYLGQFDQSLKGSHLFVSAADHSKGIEAGENHRRYVLEIDALVLGGKLQMKWTYGTQLHHSKTIEALAKQYLEALREIISHCEIEGAAFTPSDFPLARLQQSEFDRCVGRRKDIEDIYPLSPMQQGLLFHSVYETDTRAYFNQLSCHIRGDIDLASFRNAWELTVQRHSILRTAFVWETLREPLQIVSRSITLPWSDEDWSGLSPAEQREQWQRFLRADQECRFDFMRAPLMRFAVRRTGAKSFYFAWSDHHILMDGWSHQIVLGEVFAIYKSLAGGEQPHLKSPRSYRQYIEWLSSQDEQRAKTFWHGELEGFSTPIRVWMEKTAVEPIEPEEEYAQHGMHLSSQLMTVLAELAHKQRVTLNIVLQGAWAVLLGRHSGESDVVFGAVSGRSSALPGIEEIPGLFINTLPVRCRLSFEKKIGSLFQELQSLQGRIRQYEYTPLMKVQEWSEVPSGVSLFDYILAFENYPLDASLQDRATTGLLVDQIETFDVPHYPLTLRMTPAPAPFLELMYSGRRFAPEDVQRLLKHLRTLLESMAANPAAELASLSLMESSEKRQVLEEFNQTYAEYPRTKCLHQLFEEQVRKTPGAVALICGQERLTFDELNQKANQLAHYLRELGISAEHRVGLGLNRSSEMVVGVLAILKAGAAYLPLDLNYPAARLQFVIEDAATAFILTRTDLRQFIKTNAHCVCLDELALQLAKQSCENLASISMPDNLAYVLYTSGSTGRPKGVMVPNRAVVNYLNWAVQKYQGSGAGSIMHTPLGFDLTVTSLYVPLLSGQSVELVPEMGTDSIEGLRSVLAAGTQRSLMKVTPAHLALMEQLVATQHAQRSTQVMVIGGETLYGDNLEFWRRHAPEMRLINEYGPTETVVGCCVYEVATQKLNGSIPIGRPIGNARIYILDEELHPVPVGIKGEIYVGGEGVGRGYLNRAELTAEKFIADPYAGEPGKRMYKTGDLGRWNGSGVLEYLGRNDDQVKLHGYRIELGEIESVLRQAPNVRAAVVLKKEAHPGHSLVAYVVLKRPQTLDRQALKAFLTEKLPYYMVPESMIALERIPYTTNGKVNRAALLTMGTVVEREHKLFVAPKTQMEDLVAGIWADVLGREKINVHDNFFDLGGQSMIAVRIIGRLRAALNVEVTPGLLFQSGTVARLAQRIEELAQTESGLAVPPLMAVPRTGKLPLSYAQERLWFFDQFAPGGVAYNIVQGLTTHGQLNLHALELSVNEILRRHESFRTTFSTLRGEPYQEIHPAKFQNIPVLDLSEEDGEKRELRIRQIIRHEEQTPFDLLRGPLVRVKFCRLAPQEHVLLFALHHIIFDAWSANVLVHELEALYEAFNNGRPSPLSDLSIQYGDFAQWERALMQGERFKHDLEFWKQHLRMPLPTLQLRTDFPRPAVQSFRGAKHDVKISSELAGQLRRSSHEQGSTLFMTLFAAFNVLMWCESAQTDIVVGTDVANRSNPETEGLIGFFVNQIPLRTDLSAGSFSDLLKRVRQTALNAYAHQQVPLDRLVTELRIERTAQSTPVFQVKFVLVNTPATSLNLYGLQVVPMEFTAASAKLDITMMLTESADGLEGWIEYNCDLFKPATIARMGERFTAILGRIAQHPHMTLEDIHVEMGDLPQQLFNQHHIDGSSRSSAADAADN